MTSKNAVLELAPNAAYWHSSLNQDDVLFRTTDSTQKIFLGTTSNAEPALTISGNNLLVSGTMTATSYSNLPPDSAGVFGSNQSGAGVWASNATPVAAWASNAIAGAAGGITFSSNLAVAASSAATYSSNLGVWCSNTLPTLNGTFSSNTAAAACNVAIYSSNALPALSVTAAYSSNLVISSSNTLFPQTAYGSNQANTATTSAAAALAVAQAGSNIAVAASNDASVGHVLGISTSNALYPLGAYNSNTANSALGVAQAASNVAIAASNDASAGHALGISTSNVLFPLGLYNSNTANSALATALWSSNNGGGGAGSASYWQLSNSVQYSISNVSIGTTSNGFPLQIEGTCASKGLVVGRGGGAMAAMAPSTITAAQVNFSSNTAAFSSNLAFKGVAAVYGVTAFTINSNVSAKSNVIITSCSYTNPTMVGIPNSNIVIPYTGTYRMEGSSGAATYTLLTKPGTASNWMIGQAAVSTPNFADLFAGDTLNLVIQNGGYPSGTVFPAPTLTITRII